MAPTRCQKPNEYIAKLVGVKNAPHGTAAFATINCKVLDAGPIQDLRHPKRKHLALECLPPTPSFLVAGPESFSLSD
jgi:hypothetical protein